MSTNSLAKLIKSRRLNLNISQRELASRMKCDVKTISEIEKGIRRKPKISTLEKLSDELYIEMDELLVLAGYINNEIKVCRNKDKFIEEVPFTYVLTIVGQGLVETNDINEAQQKAASLIADILIDTVGINDNWDNLLENSDNCFVCISLNQENEEKNQ